MRKPENDLPEKVMNLLKLAAKDNTFNLENFRVEIETLSWILLAYTRVLRNKRKYIELESGFRDVLFIGDTHGDVRSTVKAIKPFLKGAIKNMVFLGDYVDRGKNSTLNIVLILSLAIAWPNQVILLRGNHEDWEINCTYGFKNELESQYPKEKYDTRALIQKIKKFYDFLPLVVKTVNGSIAMHGGIPRGLVFLDDLEKRSRPLKVASFREALGANASELVDDDVSFQIRWNDPAENQEKDFMPSFRGAGVFTFNERVVDDFLFNNGGKQLIRAHESSRGGFQLMFDGMLYHVFSSEPYFGHVRKAAVIHEKESGLLVPLDLNFNPY
ncbi:MAG: metallophosphoesterase [Promethearchaeota archaeon]